MSIEFIWTGVNSFKLIAKNLRNIWKNQRYQGHKLENNTDKISDKINLNKRTEKLWDEVYVVLILKEKSLELNDYKE